MTVGSVETRENDVPSFSLGRNHVFETGKFCCCCFFSYDFWGLMLCIQTLKLEAILIVTQCVCHFEDEKTRDRYPRV